MEYILKKKTDENIVDIFFFNFFFQYKIRIYKEILYKELEFIRKKAFINFSLNVYSLSIFYTNFILLFVC